MVADRHARDALADASTTPEPSCPSTAGQTVSEVPSTAFQSEWQTPLARSRTSDLARAGCSELSHGQRPTGLLEDDAPDLHALRRSARIRGMTGESRMQRHA